MNGDQWHDVLITAIWATALVAAIYIWNRFE
jgi:hypothetical protein